MLCLKGNTAGYSEKTAYMLLSTIYILVGMSCFTTIIELVRWAGREGVNLLYLEQHFFFGIFVHGSNHKNFIG